MASNLRRDVLEDEDTEDRSRLRWLLGILGVVSLLLLVVWWPGCRQYPPVTSEESSRLMKLLYAACNTRDQARLTRVEQGLEKATREGKMSLAEQKAFARVLGMARQGEWQRAEKAALRFAQDQVGRGHPAPKSNGHDHEGKPPKGTSRR